MCKNVIVNFLVLSFIVFSVEYLHYQVERQNALKKITADNIDQIRSDISGAFYNTSRPVVISGVLQPLRVRTFHISGIKATSAGIATTITPVDKTIPNNLITTSSS